MQRFASSVLLCLLLTLVLVACGDPVTQIYAENRDQQPYVLIVSADDSTYDVVSLPANDEGLVRTYPGDFSGTVDLLGANCGVIQTVEFGPDTNLITVVDGQMSAQQGADLSSRLGSQLGGSEVCP